MAKRSQLLFLGGWTAAVLLMGLLLGGSSGQRVGAQPLPAAAAVGRYQIASFVIHQPGDTPGAYILDTQTGEVVQVLGRSEPVRVAGSAARPLPPK